LCSISVVNDEEDKTRRGKYENKKKETTKESINIQGLTKRKWTALLAHPAAKDPDAIIITKYYLPFTHTPSYVKQTGWDFHTIQSPFKKDKQ